MLASLNYNTIKFSNAGDCSDDVSSFKFRSGLGQFELRSLDVYRVLGYPQEPGHALVPSPLLRPGRLAGGAQHGHDSHRELNGQQCLGRSTGRLQQTGQRQHQVSVSLEITVLLNVAYRDYRTKNQSHLLSISCRLAATSYSAWAFSTTKPFKWSRNVSLSNQELHLMFPYPSIYPETHAPICFQPDCLVLSEILLNISLCCVCNSTARPYFRNRALCVAPFCTWYLINALTGFKCIKVVTLRVSANREKLL